MMPAPAVEARGAPSQAPQQAAPPPGQMRGRPVSREPDQPPRVPVGRGRPGDAGHLSPPLEGVPPDRPPSPVPFAPPPDQPLHVNLGALRLTPSPQPPLPGTGGGQAGPPTVYVRMPGERPPPVPGRVAALVARGDLFPGVAAVPPPGLPVAPQPPTARVPVGQGHRD
jgi:hypothetical protein